MVGDVATQKVTMTLPRGAGLADPPAAQDEEQRASA